MQASGVSLLSLFLSLSFSHTHADQPLTGIIFSFFSVRSRIKWQLPLFSCVSSHTANSNIMKVSGSWLFSAQESEKGTGHGQSIQAKGTFTKSAGISLLAKKRVRKRVIYTHLHVIHRWEECSCFFLRLFSPSPRPPPPPAPSPLFSLHLALGETMEDKKEKKN